MRDVFYNMGIPSDQISAYYWDAIFATIKDNQQNVISSD